MARRPHPSSSIGDSFSGEQWDQVNFRMPRSLKNVVTRLAELQGLGQGDYILKLCMDACVRDIDAIKGSIHAELQELDAIRDSLVAVQPDTQSPSSVEAATPPSS